jgi:hypothetical protein
MDPTNVQSFGYIIHAGLQGRHILFENNMIRRSLSQDLSRYKKATQQKNLAVKITLDLLVKLPTLEEKRLLITSLPDDVRDLLIYYYFQFLDKFVQELRPTIH